VRVRAFDHVVLLCRDVEASLAFYTGVLGLEGEQVEEWRAGTAFFPSVRINDDTIIDLLNGEPDGRNTDHFCLVLEPTDLEALARRDDLDVVEGPVERGGAHGTGWSVYRRDPDGYLIELKQYGADASGRPRD
jgi:catechol 2,3-dioxygenase-like lactoylglutathione lyase family enzyme